MNLLDAMRYLVALEQHRHFGRAASACHITQPALSNALRALEAELGVAIVRRGRAYEGLTAEGERVLASANRLLHEQELLRQDLHSSADAPRGTLTIGAVPTTIPVAARFAAQLRARHAGIVPVLRSLSSPEIETGLETLALDLGLGYTERGTRFDALPQYVESYFLLRRAQPAGDAPLVLGAPIGWREAAALPLCLLTPEMHNRSIVDAAFRAAGAEPRPAIETNSIVTAVFSVLDGDVCAVLPGALLELVRGHGGLELRPLREPEPRTPIGFMAAPGSRRSRALAAALALAADETWRAQAAALGGGRFSA
ncbi:MAG TPA: LysR substrate-binding domain-containing protein [Burkholderiaceae bacterium]|nr:LysR substrate-binding domain-containing protein [Burkholderiaceae bacterium]